jgi:hypothetical protein
MSSQRLLRRIIFMIELEKNPDIISRLPSIGLSKVFQKVKNESCWSWQPEPEKPMWLFKAFTGYGRAEQKNGYCFLRIGTP